MKKRALLSVSDKTGIVEFANGLIELGFEIVSTGGTAKTLSDAGVPNIRISDVTHFPECLDGRVKTLHPAVHAGLLAMRQNPEHMAQLEKLGIGTIDIVAVNLYPFKATILKPGVEFCDAVENIDIGGPTMIRAAAKNYQDVAVIVDPDDYAEVLGLLAGAGIDLAFKKRLTYKVFSHTAAYDALISNYLGKQLGIEFPDELTLSFTKKQDLRYGENPHQSGAFYADALPAPGSLSTAVQLQGKELSYNNINDAGGALDLLNEFSECACVAVKHANPCGASLAHIPFGASDSPLWAYRATYECDPVSIFGGIVAFNRTVDGETAAELTKIFLEIVIAPDFTPEALEIFKQKPNLRVLQIPELFKSLSMSGVRDMKKVYGGLLVQDKDDSLYNPEEMRVVTKCTPTKEQLARLKFAYAVVKHTKSNGIVVAGKTDDYQWTVVEGLEEDTMRRVSRELPVTIYQTVGIGGGQTNRIDAAKQALGRAGERARGAVMASDAYFPFPDCVEEAAKAGIAAIIQPGGSIRDQESIDMCDKHGIAMVFVGQRHFKH
ncbi:MAG: bifunctional phosphoribosylaminoimidazolecarboxamide formyltransferase/IMP cyclohydrolase [Firmicutes bacterium]|nr:bifunctional phosphoribosylaminoimidazolecarboxamide formyltransferase/IMP cyclohydrolase [Bacillota bacterium]